MSRHSASFEVERPVPAEVAQELLPRPDIKSEAALPAPLLFLFNRQHFSIPAAGNRF